MVLRCSLIGHDFGDPEVDREREERGSEVVAIVTEYERCARCGERHVISENTEVTSLAPDVDLDDPGTSPADDAEILADGPPDPDPDHDHDHDRDRGEWPDSDDVGPPVGAESEPAAWPDSDDGELAFDERAREEDDAVFVDAAAETVDSTAGIASAGSAPTPGEGPPPEGVPTEFFCPRCSFVSSADNGSLRPGDICPDCRKGYLGERPR